MTLEIRDMSEKIAESGTRRVGIPEEDRERARSRPRKDGAVSATTTVIFRFRAAAFKKASTVCE